MTEKKTIIVLRNIKYNDKFTIIDTFSKEGGRESFFVRNVSSRKRGNKSAIYQPLSILEIEVNRKNEQSMGTVKNGSFVYIYNDIPFNPVKSTIVFFLAEFLYRAIYPNIIDVDMFEYICHSMIWLDTCSKKYANFHLVFTMKIAHFLGISPNANTYRTDTYFDLLNAQFTSEQPKEHGHFIPPVLSQALSNLLRLNYHNMHLFKMNKNERYQCLVYINEYYRLHIPNFPMLKTLDILKTIFDNV